MAAAKHVVFRVDGAPAETSSAAAISTTTTATMEGGMRMLKPRTLLGDESAEAYACRFSPDGRFVAVGAGDGSVRVYNAATGDESFRLRSPEPAALPITSLRWRPPSATQQNVLLAVGSDGSVRHWHVTTSKCLNSFTEKIGGQQSNQIFAVDYRPDAEKFLTAGKDGKLRLYDDMTRTCELVLEGGATDASAGHSSRVFSVKFDRSDPHFAVSGGWDNTVQVWDCRIGRSIRSIYGPHVCGDAVDLREGTLLTGSWKPRDALQLWDFATGRQLLSADIKSPLNGEPCLLYTAQFSPKGRWIAVGGTGSNEARILQPTGQVVAAVTGFPKGIFSLDFSPDETTLVTVGPNAGQIFDLRPLQ